MRRLLVAAFVLTMVAAGCSSGETSAGEASAGDPSATSLVGVLTGAALDGDETSSVVVNGDVLEPLGQGIAIGTAGNDPVVGQTAPRVSGEGFDGSAVAVGSDGRAKAIYFVAHWCPHCQEEIPAVVELMNSGQVPDGLDVYVVSTGVRDGQPNFPPSKWLESENWPGSILRDDEANTAAIAFGVGGFPYAIYLDSANIVVGRSQGRVDAAATLTLWNLAAGSDPS